MKNSISALVASAICIAAICGCKNIVTFEALPAEAQTFLTENFPDSPVSYAVKEGNEYDVTLTDGTEIEFNGKGEWKTVEMKHKTVPAAVLATLPPSVSSYLTSSFGNVPVEKVEKGTWPAYKAELVNGLEVYFNSKGICTKVDD
ncbi:MAG: PepSY-like domain-containing protein [Bacteroidales bacterium]|nr:PepSY-like domain-containing protein [Candidatus Hennigimonas equi]